MSFNELIHELHKLSPAELEAVQRELDGLQQNHDEETPEMLAAIDEGLRSLREEPTLSLEQVIAEMRTWNTKSP